MYEHTYEVERSSTDVTVFSTHCASGPKDCRNSDISCGLITPSLFASQCIKAIMSQKY